MINLYCRLIDITLIQLKTIIEGLFPQNKSSIIENGTVFLSEGGLFDCSVEPSFQSKGLYLSANYMADIELFQKDLNRLINEIENNDGVYDIEYEIEKGGKFVSSFLRHPEFAKKITPSNEA